MNRKGKALPVEDHYAEMYIPKEGCKGKGISIY